MGYFRHIQATRLPVEVISLALDENRAVLRFLTRLTPEDQNTERQPGDAGDLIRTKTLAAPFVPITEAKTAYNIQGQEYVIFAEAVLDRRVDEYARLWVPGTHFEFHLDPARGLKIDPKGALSGPTRRNTAELIRYMGGLWVFGLWVRNPETPVNQCSRSVTTAPGTILLTNLKDLGELQTADFVMAGGRSKWLTLNYRLTADSDSVVPDGMMDYTFEVLDGKTGGVATDISWDGWRIDAVDGYAPRRRILVKNGIGRFRVYAMGLLSGETMRVKVQNRFDPSIAECTVKVL